MVAADGADAAIQEEHLQAGSRRKWPAAWGRSRCQLGLTWIAANARSPAERVARVVVRCHRGLDAADVRVRRTAERSRRSPEPSRPA